VKPRQALHTRQARGSHVAHARKPLSQIRNVMDSDAEEAAELEAMSASMDASNKASVFAVTQSAAVPRSNNRQKLPWDAWACILTTKVLQRRVRQCGVIGSRGCSATCRHRVCVRACTYDDRRRSFGTGISSQCRS
jgi:hypothetical protein